METIKNYLLGILFLAAGVFYTLFRVQQKKTAQAKAELSAAAFKLTTQENDKAYEAAKDNANKLVTDYQSSRRADSAQ